jgi:hypothetical protein
MSLWTSKQAAFSKDGTERSRAPVSSILNQIYRSVFEQAPLVTHQGASLAALLGLGVPNTSRIANQKHWNMNRRQQKIDAPKVYNQSCASVSCSGLASTLARMNATFGMAGASLRRNAHYIIHLI